MTADELLAKVDAGELLPAQALALDWRCDVDRITDEFGDGLHTLMTLSMRGTETFDAWESSSQRRGWARLAILETLAAIAAEKAIRIEFDEWNAVITRDGAVVRVSVDDLADRFTGQIQSDDPGDLDEAVDWWLDQILNDATTD